jgi:hypothetical protein
MSLMRATTHQHSLPDPCRSSTQLCAQQPSLRDTAIRVRASAYDGSSRGRETGIRTGPQPVDTVVNALVHSVGVAVTVPVCDVTSGCVKVRNTLNGIEDLDSPWRRKP